jgi:hypothetical protein
MTTVAFRRAYVLVIALMLGLGLVFQGALPARSCTCMQPDPYAGLVEADGAFVGALVDVDGHLGPVFDSGTLIDYEFEVETAVKGDIRDTIVVKSAADGASCGLEMPVGARVGILLDRVGDQWERTCVGHSMPMPSSASHCRSAEAWDCARGTSHNDSGRGHDRRPSRARPAPTPGR